MSLQNCQICCPTSGNNGSWISNLLVLRLPKNSPIHPNSYFLEDPNYSATAGMDAVLKCSWFANVGNAAGYLEPHARQHVFQCCWESGPGGGWARQASSSLKCFFDQVSPCYLMVRLVASHLHTQYFNQTLLLSEHVVHFHGVAPVQLYHDVPFKLLHIFAFAAWAACRVSCPA